MLTRSSTALLRAARSALVFPLFAALFFCGAERVGAPLPAAVAAGPATAPTAVAAPAPAAPSPLAQARIDAAAKALALVQQQFTKGARTLDDVQVWSRRWLESFRDSKVTGPALVDAAKAHLATMQQLEELTKKRYPNAIDEAALHMSAYYRAEAEYWLAEAQGK
ncbi:MAG: hypothetical protein NVSMB47_03780 [Polyangiales bacterium]